MPFGKHYISANAYLEDAWRLAARVVRSGWKPDLLIALWRGGAPVGVALHEFFKVAGWNVNHLPLRCGSYTGIGASSGTVSFEGAEPVFASLVRGAKVLVVDDVFDSGRTAAAMKARLDACGVESRVACVYFKPQNNVTDIRPDYFERDVGTEWIVFPHEIDGLSPDEISAKSPLLAELLGTREGGR